MPRLSTLSLLLGAVSTAALISLAPSARAQGRPAADALADRFSGAGDAEAKSRQNQADKQQQLEAQRQSAERLRQDEADMLARAKAEAEERRADIEKSRIEADTMEAAAVAAEAVREAADSEQLHLEDAKKVSAARRAADEKIIADAKAGEAARLAAIKEAEDKLKIAEARLKATEEELQAAEARKVAAEQKTRDAIVDAERAEAERLKQAKAAEIKHLEITREAEARSLAEKIKRAAEQRAAEAKIQSSASQVGLPTAGPVILQPAPAVVSPPAAVPAKSAAIPYTETEAAAPVASPAAAPKPAAPSIARWSSSGPDNGRVAVLLVMTPGKRGIRRLEPTADPVLCGPEGCYVSQGSVMPANFRSIQQALGPSNTWGDRAGACKRSLGCVFRNVDLAMLSFHLQPVDMRVLNHDWRERKRIDADSACTSVSGRLSCTVPVLAEDYRLWIVPETMAASIGTDALDAAVRDGLQGQRASLQ